MDEYSKSAPPREDAGRASEARYSMNSYGNVLAIVWHASPDLVDLVAIDEQARALVQTHGKIALLIVVEPVAAPPTAEFKKKNAEMFNAYASKIFAMAKVIEGSGMKYTLVRLAFSTIDLMSVSGIPEKTVDSVAAATEWLSQLDLSIAAKEIEAMVRGLRV